MIKKLGEVSGEVKEFKEEITSSSNTSSGQKKNVVTNKDELYIRSEDFMGRVE